MPFFRVFLPGCRKGHTRHTAGRWARDARDTGKSAGNARMSGASCAGRAKQARQQDERDRKDERDERGAYGSLSHLSFSDCPFCEHVLRKNNALSRLQGRFTPPRATRWLLPKNVNMLHNLLLH